MLCAPRNIINLERSYSRNLKDLRIKDAKVLITAVESDDKAMRIPFLRDCQTSA